MKTYLDCYPCFVNQALRTGRMVTSNESIIKHLIGEIGLMLKDIPLTSTPPETGEIIFRKVREISGITDPLKEVKDHSTCEVLKIYPRLQQMVHSSDDPLMTAVRLSIAGNVIDFGIHDDYDIESEISETLEKQFAICDMDEFRNALKTANHILFIGDNAGESVFDRLLIETIGKPTIYVVRAEPVLNDVTYLDAVAAGIGQVAEIVSSGSTAPGTILNTCRLQFRELFYSADMVISKGQGNYEGLSEEDRSVFFLLKAKCHIIARDLGVPNGAIILANNKRKDRT